MTTLLETTRKPLGTILPLAQAKRWAVIDAIEQCHGNHPLAARLFALGERDLPDGGCAEISSIQDAGASIDGCVSTFVLSVVPPPNGQHMNTDEKSNFVESAALLHAIFPRYPDVRGMNQVPEVGAFLVALRSQSLTGGEPEKLIPAVATADTKSS